MDNKYDDIETLQPDLADDYLDDGFDDELDDYGDGGEGDYRSGEQAFNDYQSLKDEQKDIQERLENAQNEMEKDTKEIPPEGKDTGSGEGTDGNSSNGESSDKSSGEGSSESNSNSSNNSENNDSNSKKDSSGESKKDDVPPEGTQSGRTPASEKPDHSNDDGMRGVVPNQDTGNGSSSPKKDDENNQNKDNKENKENDQKKNESGESSNNQQSAKDKDGRDIVGVNPDGTQIVKKNDKDRKNDKKELNRAKAANVANKVNKARAVADMASDPVGAAKAMAKQKIKEKTAEVVVKILPKILPYVLPVIGIGLLLFALIILIVAVVVIIAGESDNVGIFEYYEPPCQNIVVEGLGSYSLDDYAAGVVTAEVGEFSDSPETLKAFAIAARTYGLSRAATNNCTIANSAAVQAFSSSFSQSAIDAAQATTGLILVNEDGNLVSTEYDAFAFKRMSIGGGDYILKQKDQHIPKEWVESKISATRLEYYRNHHHGRGMSQWGAYYLATEQGYLYADILYYYYTNYQIRITTHYGGYSGESGQILAGMPLSQYLQNVGTSIDMFNSKIISNVNAAGFGTRAGVVAAATTLIGEASNVGITLPYVWGGGHGAISQGADPNWGNNSGLDCSGFVSWAIYNGGFNFSAVTSGSFNNYGSVVSLSAVDAVLQPGDLMWRPPNGSSTGHIVLVISVDTDRNKYICAEANSSSTGIIFKERDFGATGYRGIKMDSYYVESNKR